MPSRTTTIITLPIAGRTSHLLTRPGQTQWHRSGTGSNCCTSTTMGDDPPDSGEAEERQSSGCDRGAPVAVGLVVAHPGIDDAGPTLHHLGKHLQRSRWPTGTDPEVAHTSVPAGRNTSGRHYKEHEAYLYKSADKNLTTDKRKRLYSKVFGSQVKAPRSRAKYDDFYDVTRVLDKAVSYEPHSMQVELLRNKCIVIFRIFLISRSADLATLQPYLFTSQNRFYVRFLNKVGKWRNHSVTGQALLFLSRISRKGVLPTLFFF